MIKVFGEGRLTRDSEQKYAASGTAICNFSVACDYYAGEKKVTFLRCTMFGKKAESLHQYLNKGQAVSFMGNLEIREYEGKYYTSCIVDDIELVGSKSDNQSRQQNTQQSAPVDQDNDDSIPF